MTSDLSSFLRSRAADPRSRGGASGELLKDRPTSSRRRTTRLYGPLRPDRICSDLSMDDYARFRRKISTTDWESSRIEFASNGSLRCQSRAVAHDDDVAGGGFAFGEFWLRRSRVVAAREWHLVGRSAAAREGTGAPG